MGTEGSNPSVSANEKTAPCGRFFRLRGRVDAHLFVGPRRAVQTNRRLGWRLGGESNPLVTSGRPSAADRQPEPPPSELTSIV